MAVITLTLDRETVTQTKIGWIADVSTGYRPGAALAYTIYYKKSADTDWIWEQNYGVGTVRRWTYLHSNLEPGTSYDFQVYILDLDSVRQLFPSNVLTARTRSRPPAPIVDPIDPPTNNPPVFRSASEVSIPENTTAVITVVAEDPDAEDEITNYAITGGADASLFQIGGTGTPLDVLCFKEAPDFEMPGSAANSNIYTLILTATSGAGDRAIITNQTLTITVTDVDETPPEPVNRPPVFQSAAAVSVPENTTAVLTVVAEDPDTEDAMMNYAMTGGADKALFQMAGESDPLDLLRFKAAPDFEIPGSAANSNVYTLVLMATSGAGDRALATTQTLTITVIDVDEPPANNAPVFTEGESTTRSVAENTASGENIGAPVAATDADGDTLTYTLGGTDAAAFSLVSTSGQLQTRAALDYETKNAYTVTVSVSDGKGGSDAIDVTITVRDVDEPVEPPEPPPEPVNRPPVFRSASAVNVPENTTVVLTIVAEDPDDGDAITSYAITGGADRVQFELGGVSTPLDVLRFKTAPDFEKPMSAANSNVYTLALTATGGVGTRELTTDKTLIVTVTDVDEPVEPPIEPPVEPPIEPPIEPPVSVGGGAPVLRPPVPLLTHAFIFNEIANASEDSNDWIELKNLSNGPLRLSDWQVRLMTGGEEIDVVAFPDVLLPPQGVLLITNTDPRETRLASGLNIGTGARLRGAQHPYLVAPDLKLPSEPYLLVLQRRATTDGGSPPATIEDVAGNYFRRVWPYATAIYPVANTSLPTETEAAPLTESGVYQRQRLEYPGYLAAAWEPSGYHGGIGYDRHAAVSVALGTPGYRRDPSPAQPVAYRLVFNEIRNAKDDINDYIELKNVCGAGVRLKDWEISLVASVGEAVNEDVDIVSFPDYTLPMGGVLLITPVDPGETDLAGGLNIATGARQRGSRHPYIVAPDLKLPSEPYLLILRYAREKNGTPVAIEDVAGNYFRGTVGTDVWPLSDIRHPTVPAAPLSAAGTWQRIDVREPGYLASAWTVSDAPPGLGYDRHAVGENAPGAPGFGAAVGFNPTLPDEVRVSELMFETQGPWHPARHQLPQWMELYNASEAPVNLKGWELAIETRTAEVHRHATLTLTSVLIPPKQTVLLVSRYGRNSVSLPAERVYDLSDAHPDAFSDHPRRRDRLGDTLIGTDGFFLKLTHPTGRVVDTCGNIDGDPRTKDLPTWTLPMCLTPNRHRASLLRRFEASGDVMKGTEASGWQRTADVAIGVTHYYGHRTDISHPGGLHGILPGMSPTVALHISEIMFTAKMKRWHHLPQWIELYNPSFVAAVNLKGFQLVVETRKPAGKPHQLVIELEAMHVLPNQTVLLVTGRGQHSGHFPANRVYNLSARHPEAFASLQEGQHLLSGDGFLLQLSDVTGNVVDTVGNLDGYPFTDDAPAWALPMSETPEGARASIRRLSEKQIPLDGTQPEGWVSTAAVPPALTTYYGHPSDAGNPGYRKGGPLPVTLSRFRAVRNADAVVVSWTTESSLENAGFHLYRSAERTGGFIRVNPSLIQGAGTTAERRVYTYVDKPPNPDVVYYYQIQEVSYSGQQQVLATCRVKGYLSADGKSLTTLGAVKTRK